jgi:hypothetical protein
MEKFIIRLLLCSVCLALPLVEQDVSVAQVCYMQTPDGHIIDLIKLCTPHRRPTLSDFDDSIIPIEEMESLAKMKLVQDTLDEVYKACSPKCRTDEELSNALYNFCSLTKRCPPSLFTDGVTVIQ